MKNKFNLSINRKNQYKIIDKDGKVITYLGKKQYFRLFTTADTTLKELKKVFLDRELKVETN